MKYAIIFVKFILYVIVTAQKNYKFSSKMSLFLHSFCGVLGDDLEERKLAVKIDIHLLFIARKAMNRGLLASHP